MLQITIANPEEEVKVLLQPWQLLLLVLASWVNRQQQDVIEYGDRPKELRHPHSNPRKAHLIDVGVNSPLGMVFPLLRQRTGKE